SIYIPLLLPEGHGYPLWLSAPISNLPLDFVRHGTQIGDLGYLACDGGFMYLFNVCKDATDPVNLNRSPPSFIPLTNTPGMVHSSLNSTYTRVGTTVLVLPDGTERSDSEEPSLFEEYAIANVHSWYKYFNGQQGRKLYNGSLYLITSCDKCCCWS
ncbi:uncharacterized protein EV420DRAFT_1234457, partial [Desarmillaria tabescens]